MKNKLSNPASAAFCQSMGMMLGAGISVDEAASLLHEDCEEGDLKLGISTVLKLMDEGKSFSAAITVADFLPSYAEGMIEIGEQSGRLEQVLLSLSKYYDRQELMRLKIKNALVYPTILLFLMCGVLIIMVELVLPVFIKVYENMSGTLTGSAYSYVSAASVISNISLFITVALCLILLIGIVMFRFKKGRDIILSLLEKFPPTKDAVYKMSLFTLSDVLATFCESGMDESSALTNALPLITHRGLKKTCETIINDSEKETLSKSFYNHKVFPPLYSRMLVSADRSGRFSDSIRQLSLKTGEDAADKITSLIEMIEPVLTAFLTVCVGLTLLCVMLPLIGILGSIG